MTTTEILAEYVLDLRPENLSSSSIEIAKHSILDLIGAAVAGFSTSSASVYRETAPKFFSAGSASIWFSGQNLHPAASALVNSAAASALDIDDGNRQAGGHPGASMIPAAFALAQHLKASVPELLTAIVAGYEIGIRVARSRDFSALATYSTGRWCSFGAAAVAGCLYKSDVKEFAHSLAIAGVQSPDMAAAGYSRFMGNSVKEGIAWSTMTGIFAHELGRSGFTGPLDILDHPDYYDTNNIVKDLNGSKFLIEETYFKPYACCRWLHSSIDGLLLLMEENSIKAESIQKISVNIFSRALTLNNYIDPDSLEAAQYSIPFCLAVAAIEGKRGLLPMKHEFIQRSDIVAFAKKVELIGDAGFDKMFPECTPAAISIKVPESSFKKVVIHPLGEPSNPMKFSILEDKFYKLVQSYITLEKANMIVNTIKAIEEKNNPEELFQLIKTL